MPRISSKFSSANSAITCLQTPHGGQYVSIFPFGPPTTAIFLNLVMPSLTALNIAVRSAQFVGV